MTTMIIIAPLGMKYDLARKLVEDNAFAHMWLCHNGNADECPDGCDGSGTSGNVDVRTKLYENIRIYHTKSDLDAYRRGYRDSLSGKGSIWRRVGDRIVSDMDDDMADNWELSERQAYLDGYDRGSFHTH